MTPLRIGSRLVGPDQPAYLVAELSANHHGSLDEALALVRAARDAGADAVKLQTYTADTMTLDCDGAPFRIQGTIWHGRRLFELYREASTPWEWHPTLLEEARRVGLDCFSTPFDASAVDFLEKLGVPAHKVASFENGDIPLLRKVGATHKPVILSTGMAELAEIDEAVAALRGAGCVELALLKCTSAYPAPPEEMNLRAIPELAARFGVPVGLSDHTLGHAAAVAAVALGACIIEKHFTLSRSRPGPDSAFSMEPSEFRVLVDAVRTAQQALGEARLGLQERERPSRAFRRSLFAALDIRAGDALTSSNVRCVRPGHGLPPRDLERVLGRRAARDVARGTPLSWELVEGGDAR